MNIEVQDRRRNHHAHVNEFRFIVCWTNDYAHTRYSHKVHKIILNLGGRLSSPYRLPLERKGALLLALKMMIRERYEEAPLYISRVD